MRLNRPLPPLPPLRGVFITGTDTDVGKTWVAAGLTAALRQRGVQAVYFKPVQSGCPQEGGRLIPTDADFARTLAGLDEPLEVLTPIALSLPLAPGVAAAQAGVEVDLGRIASGLKDLAARYEFLVVEGAGGLYVPLVGMHFLVLDLIRWLGLPLAVVAKSGLGTINHTVLTVKAAQAAGIEVAGVILNRYPEPPGLAAATNPGVIEALTGVPILGRLPEVADLGSPAAREIFLAALTPIAENFWEGALGRRPQPPP
ncbi:MAG: dethiobiotin synthase [Desulfobaccales bacterium]